MRQVLRGAFWILVYGVVTIAPLLVVGLDPKMTGQGIVIDVSVALGFLSLTIMVLQFGLVARLQRIAAPFGLDALIQFHRQVGYVAFVFAIVHPVMLFVHTPAKLALLNLPVAPNRARFATGAVVALFLLLVTSVWRKQLRLRYEVWQVLHALLAIVIVVCALGHMAGVSYYSASLWQRVLWAGMAAGVVGDLLWVRLIKPIRQYRRPWIVDEVVEENGDAWSVVMRPDGHEGMQFLPGQFGWVVINRSPFAFSQHPFSFSSSAEDGARVSMTIKSAGDFTSTIKDVEPGTRAYLDGPYGLFSPDDNEGFGFVLIGGGVGITPLMSILRTMKDRDDKRPVVLFYGVQKEEDIIFRTELDALQNQLNLEVVYALDHPPENWSGAIGHINKALIVSHLPRMYRRFRFFVCGAPPMMDAMEAALVDIGIEDEFINTERFDMV